MTRRSDQVRAVLKPESIERKKLQEQVRSAVAKWAELFPDDVRISDMNEITLLECRDVLARASDSLCDAVCRSNSIALGEIREDSMRGAFFDARMNGASFFPLMLSAPGRASPVYRKAEESYRLWAGMMKGGSEPGFWRGLASFGTPLFGKTATGEGETVQTLIDHVQNDLVAYARWEFGKHIPWDRISGSSILLESDLLNADKLESHYEKYRCFPVKAGFEALARTYVEDVINKVNRRIETVDADYRTALRHSSQVENAEELRKMTKALFKKANKIAASDREALLARMKIIASKD